MLYFRARCWNILLMTIERDSVHFRILSGCADAAAGAWHRRDMLERHFGAPAAVEELASWA